MAGEPVILNNRKGLNPGYRFGLDILRYLCLFRVFDCWGRFSVAFGDVVVSLRSAVGLRPIPHPSQKREGWGTRFVAYDAKR